MTIITNDAHIIEDCKKCVWQCCATAYIFQDRARIIGRRLRLLSFLGIVVPASVGGIILSFRVADNQWLNIIITIAGITATIQLIFSVLSITHKWDDQCAYAQRSVELNTRLRRKYERLINDETNDIQNRFNVLQEQDTELQIEDERQGITDNERRIGMRFSLFQYHKECISCGIVPQSMSPSACNVCGNFKRRSI